jgi:hypothetical protein
LITYGAIGAIHNARELADWHKPFIRVTFAPIR